MANTRIRYKSIGDNLLKSVRVFSVNDTALSVTLDTENKRFTIVDENSGDEVMTGGKTKNLAVLKIQAKKALSDLGVSFGEETRNRGNDDSTDNIKVSVGPTNLESNQVIRD